MGSRKKKSNDRAFRGVLLIIVIIFILIFIGLAVKEVVGKKQGGYEAENQKETSDMVGIVTDTSETEEKDIFPYELEDGKLVVESLFQYSGFNPDCGDEEGENIASLEIVNSSDEFCKLVEITVVMQDGTEIPFKATNIPAGKKVWMFASDNQSIDQKSVCKEIIGEAQFGEASMMEKQIGFNVEDTAIKLQNLTKDEITDFSVDCHCLFEDVYFGGVTYSYFVKSIPSGETITIDANDCYMGTAEIVVIEKKN